ncbi:hypothetical protein pb186bvf_004842 [Paramecium bursaria]
MEAIELLGNRVDHKQLQEDFNINFNMETYQTNIQIYEYIEFFKLGQVKIKQSGGQNIIYNNYSSKILEKIMTCVVNDEPCLLIGDTGCGKTTLTQHCADLFGKKLHVFNLSEGSDSQDLIGGFRPLSQDILFKINFGKFLKEFQRSVDMKKNQQFVEKLRKLYMDRKHQVLLKCMIDTAQQCIQQLKGDTIKWQRLYENLQAKGDMNFYFITGNLIKAMKKGDWVLIDEINLANNEVLQKILPAIEKTKLLFFERGDENPIQIHPDFRLFGCMNPGHDVGKKELPINIRNKFTQLHIEDMNHRSDIVDFIRGIINNFDVQKIADLYIQLRQDRVYSLRNLSRALNYYKNNPSLKSMFNGLCMAFGSGMSQDQLEQFYIKLADIGLDRKLGQMQQNYRIFTDSIEIYGFKLIRGPLKPYMPQNYLITPSNQPYLLSCLRALSGTGLPILLEGPTSGGKTSLVQYIATLCGQRCHRINNHQNTEVEEYLGTYAAVENSIQFQEGLLVQAIRNGDWIILDELNLARSEILENLNRLLDDNQELFLPETQQILKPHLNFRIFATQNPISYGGRKQLSKAFRNRFIEIQVQEINSEDLTNILTARCQFLPPTYIPYMRTIQVELNTLRSSDQIFMQGTGMITLRDLIKWGSRMQHEDILNSREQAAMEGYCIIAERIRDQDIKATVKRSLEKTFKVELFPEEYYDGVVKKHFGESALNLNWNKSFTRMAALTMKCILNKEPSLLVGPAGIGKTTLVQLIAEQLKVTQQHIVCHQYLEISDFVGALRPGREKEQGIFQWQDGPLLKCFNRGGIFLIDEVNMCPESVLEGLNSCLEFPASLTVNDKLYQVQNQAFAIVAAMNPSGDWGKKELTPALRSRFTEIFAENPLKGSIEDIKSIINQYEKYYSEDLSLIIQQLNVDYEITFRDLLQILNHMESLRNVQNIDILSESLDFAVLQQFENDIPQQQFEKIKQICNVGHRNYEVIQYENHLQAGPYQFQVLQPQILSIPQENLYRLIRSLNYGGKPIMIQGPPSCGKTYAIETLAAIQQKRLITIIFDEQTDLQELIGTDQPNSSLKLLGHILGKQMPQEQGQFRFVDGPLLQAIKEGHWLLLKNLNLAPQNVLEGLNSILDHRKEIFIPELGKIINVHNECRIFAIQNPMSQGEGRKGLPVSFLNRFIKMHFNEISQDILNNYGISFTKDLRIIKNCLSIPIEYREKFFINNQIQVSFNNVDRTLWTQQKTHFSDIINILDNVKSILLFGNEGLGKQTLINKIAERCQKKLVHLLLSKQTDSMELLGNYERQEENERKKLFRKYGLDENTEDDSVFQWRFSKLFEAAIKGYWVLIDNVDELNKEVLPRIGQFISQNSFIVFGEDIKIHPNFKIFLTSKVPIQLKTQIELEMRLKDNLNEIDLENYYLDIQNICKSQIMNQQARIIVQSILCNKEVVQQSLISYKVKKVAQQIESQLLFNDLSDIEIIKICENILGTQQVANLNQKIWNEQVLDQVYNQNIRIFEIYHQNIQRCHQENQFLQAQRFIYILCYYALCQDLQVIYPYLAEIMNVQKQILQENYQINIVQLSEFQRRQLQEVLVEQVSLINLDNITINFLIKKLIIQNMNNRSSLTLLLYLFKRLQNADPFQLSEELNTKEIKIKMLNNQQEWIQKKQYNSAILELEQLIETQDIKSKIDLLVEQQRYQSEFKEFLQLLKLQFLNQSIDVIQSWINGLLQSQSLKYIQIGDQQFPIINNDVNCFQFIKIITQNKNIENLQMEQINLEDLKRYLLYQISLKKQSSHFQTVKLAQTYVNYQCLKFNFNNKQQLMNQLSNPLLQDDDDVINYIQILLLKKQVKSKQEIQNLIFNSLVHCNVFEIPIYQEIIRRYKQLQSTLALNQCKFKYLDKDLVIRLIQQLIDINQDTLIKLSSKEVEVIMLEIIINQLNLKIRAEQETNFLKYSQYREIDMNLFHQYTYKLEMAKKQLFLRDPSKDNLTATQEFLDDIRDQCENLIISQNQPIFEQLCDNFILSTFKYFDGFKDILYPIFEGMINVSSQYEATLFEYQNQGFQQQLRQLRGQQFISYATQNLISQEERDLFKMDDAKLYIQMSKKINAMIIDQYTEQAVENQKKELEQLKDQEFENYKSEFQGLIGNVTKEELSKRVKTELTQLDYLTREFLDLVLEKQKPVLILQQQLTLWKQLIPDLFYDLDLGIENLFDFDEPNKIINVYKESVPLFMVDLNKYLNILLRDINKFLEDILFNDNEILKQLQILIIHLLEQSIFSTPLIKFTTGLTLILEKIEIWNSTVPLQFKIQFVELQKTIIQWRRLERQGWKSIIKNKIFEFWSVESIILFKFIQQMQTQDPAKLVDMYLYDGQVGNFEIRVILLKFILPYLDNNTIIQQKLNQASILFEKYNASMKETITGFVNEIKEYSSLVSWNSSNYQMVQQASEKMHGKLAKVQSRFRNALNEKFTKLREQYINSEYFDNIDTCIAHQKKLLYIINDDAQFYNKIENCISDSLDRMNELKESKSNVKTLALRNFQSFIETLLGLRGQYGRITDLVNEDLLLKNKHNPLLEQSQQYYYKALSILQNSLTQQIDKSIQGQIINKSISLIYVWMKKIQQIFNLLSTIFEVTEIDKEEFQYEQEFRVYSKCLKSETLTTTIEQLIQNNNNQSKENLLKLVRQSILEKDSKFDGKFHLLKNLEERLQNMQIIDQEIYQPSRQRNPKTEVIWSKYQKALKNDENIIQSEIKLLTSFNKYKEFNLDNYKGIILKNVNTLSKMLYIMTSIFCNIMIKGFCQKDDDQDEDEDGGQGEQKAGTGVGEGKGQQNVTKEIEFQEQVAGEQEEDDEQPQDISKQSQSDDDEISMDNDFNGKNEGVENENEEEEDEKDGSQDEGFSSVDQDDNENMQNQKEQDSDDEKKSNLSKKSDIEFNAEEDGKQKDLQAKEEKEKKKNSDKRNMKELQEESHQADSEAQSELDKEGLEEVESKNMSEFGGEGGEQLEEMEQEQQEGQEEQDDGPDPNDSLTMDEQDQQDQQIEEEEIKFDQQNIDQQQENKEEIKNQDLFNLEEEDNQDQQDADDENKSEGQNQLFKDLNQENQEGKSQEEQGNQGKQGQKEKDQHNNESAKGTTEGKQKNMEEIKKKLFQAVQQNQQANFTKDLNVQDEEGEEPMEEEQDPQYQFDNENNKMTNLPVFEQQQKIEQQIRNQMEIEDQDDKQKQKQQQGEFEDEKKNQIQKEFEQGVQGSNTNYDLLDIKEREFKINNIEELIEYYKRNGHDTINIPDLTKGLEVWNSISKQVINNSIYLSEQLKAILVALQSSALRGDFKSGKRLNMKKIIPYIASNFRKDKIWMRRTQPQKRNYQIMLALDDSLSMNQVGMVSLESLTSLSLALSKMECGQICIASIHEGMKLLHDLQKQFSDRDCPFMLGSFSFSYEGTQSSELSMMRFMRESIDYFKLHKNQLSQQICFIISDGKFNKKMVRPLIKEAEELKILYIFIIMDHENQSIRNIRSTNYVMKDGKQKLEIKGYLEDFPFKYYMLINQPSELNSVLINILRQHYQLNE